MIRKSLKRCADDTDVMKGAKREVMDKTTVRGGVEYDQCEEACRAV